MSSSMKVFKLWEPVPKLILKTVAALDGLGVEIDEKSKYFHPREDFLAWSKKFSVFAVADGVTLELDERGFYPNPSGAGAVAKIFCQAVVRETEKVYSRFTVPDLKKVFVAANAAVAEYNRKHGRAPGQIDYWSRDLFAATAAWAVVKDNQIYWSVLCDSGVACFDEQGRAKFKSPDCWTIYRKNLPSDWTKTPEVERKKTARRVYRNGVNAQGELIGYGVVTGEKAAERYLHRGKFTVNKGDTVFIFSDGFENYINQADFVKIFAEWPRDLTKKIKTYTANKSLQDPNNFGRERTLIALKF